MDMPKWLPDLVAGNFQLLVKDEKLSERERAFFTDARLENFWIKVSCYLEGLEHPEYLAAAAECIPGVFIAPLAFYGQTGSVDRPTPKTKARGRQKKADPLIRKAAELAGELAEKLERIEETTHVYPCELRLMTIVRELVHDEKIEHVASYYDGVPTSDALRLLEAALLKYPSADSIFDDVPGMASQKSTWRDWLREAAKNHKCQLRMHPGKFELTESDWLNLALVLIGDHVTRNSVQDALRRLST